MQIIPFLFSPCPCLASRYDFARFSISHSGLHRILKSTFTVANKCNFIDLALTNKGYTVGPCQFELGHFKFLVILNSRPLPVDLFLSHLLFVISNSRYFNLFFISPDLRVQVGFSCNQKDDRGPVRGGAHVPRLNFTATYVAISEHSRVACRNFINKCFTSFAPLTIHIRWNDANGTYGLYLQYF